MMRDIAPTHLNRISRLPRASYGCKSRTSFSAHWAVEIVSWHPIVRSSVKFPRLIQLFGGAAIIGLCSSCDEVPFSLQILLTDFSLCSATTSRYWDIDHV